MESLPSTDNSYKGHIERLKAELALATNPTDVLRIIAEGISMVDKIEDLLLSVELQKVKPAYETENLTTLDKARTMAMSLDLFPKIAGAMARVIISDLKKRFIGDIPEETLEK